MSRAPKSSVAAPLPAAAVGTDAVAVDSRDDVDAFEYIGLAVVAETVDAVDGVGVAVAHGLTAFIR